MSLLMASSCQILDCKGISYRQKKNNLMRKTTFKVAEHSLAVCEYVSFAKSWQEKGYSSQAETWQVKNILMKDFD